MNKYKVKCMKETMLKQVRSQAGLDGQEFTTNRVESINSLLKLETEGPSTIDDCINKIRRLVERQANAAVSNIMSVSREDFIIVLSNHQTETVEAVYRKAVDLKNDIRSMSDVPGGDPREKIIMSTKRGKFHHVTFGEKKGSTNVTSCVLVLE